MGGRSGYALGERARRGAGQGNILRAGHTAVAMPRLQKAAPAQHASTIMLATYSAPMNPPSQVVASHPKAAGFGPSKCCHSLTF